MPVHLSFTCADNFVYCEYIGDYDNENHDDHNIEKAVNRKGIFKVLIIDIQHE